MMTSRLLTAAALAILATALGGYARNSFVISTLNSCDGFSAATFLADPVNKKGLASCCIQCLMTQLQQQSQPCLNNGSNCGCSAVLFNPSTTTKKHCMLLSGRPQNESCGVIAVAMVDDSSNLTLSTPAIPIGTNIAASTATQYGGGASPAGSNLLQTIVLTQGSALTDGDTTATAEQYAADTGVTFTEQQATSSTSEWSTAGGDMSSSLSSEPLLESYFTTKFSYTPIVEALTEDSQTQESQAFSTAQPVVGDAFWPSSLPAIELTKAQNVSTAAEVATSPTVSITSNSRSTSGNISNISNMHNISNISNMSNMSNISNVDNSSSSSISGSTTGSPSPHFNFSSESAFPAWHATSGEPISGKNYLTPTGVGATSPATGPPFTSEVSSTISPPLPPPNVTSQPAAVGSSSAVFVTYSNLTTIARTQSTTLDAGAANHLETSLAPPLPAGHTELSPPPPCTAPPNGDVSVCASAAAIAVSAASTKTGSPSLASVTAGQPLNSTQSVTQLPPSLPPGVA